MKLFTILSIAILSATAAPTTFLIREGVNQPVLITKSAEAATILKQINHLNEDGSYVFGYEASDGTFRAENRDAFGHVTGRYGYIDANGKLQELDYVSGRLSGKTLGFQARSSMIPMAPAPVDQKTLDFKYSSVDDNQDGIPDAPVSGVVVHTPTVIRLEDAPASAVVGIHNTMIPVSVVPFTQTIASASTIPGPVDQKVLDLKYSSVDDNQDGMPDVPFVQAPTIVRLAESVVPFSIFQPAVVRTVQPISGGPVDQFIQDLRFHSVDVDEDGMPDEAIEVASVPMSIPTLFSRII